MSFNVRVIRRYDDFLMLHDEWNALVERTTGELSLTHEWIDALWNSHHGRENEAIILVLERDGKTTGFFPFYADRVSRRGISLRRLSYFTNYYCHHGNFICDSADRETIFAAFYYLTSSFTWDFLDFECFWSEGAGAKAVTEYFSGKGMRMETSAGSAMPFLPLGDSWGSYLESKDSKFRNNLKRRERIFHEAGEVRFVLYEAPHEVEQAVGDVLAVEAGSWKAKNGSAITSDPRQEAFFKALTPRVTRNGWLRLLVAYLNREPIAYDYGIHYGTVFSLLKQSHKEEFKKLSPGIVLRKKVLEELYETGCSEHDFLGEPEPWKLEWTDHLRPHQHIRVFGKTARAGCVSLLKGIKACIPVL